MRRFAEAIASLVMHMNPPSFYDFTEKMLSADEDFKFAEVRMGWENLRDFRNTRKLSI